MTSIHFTYLISCTRAWLHCLALALKWTIGTACSFWKVVRLLATCAGPLLYRLWVTLQDSSIIDMHLNALVQQIYEVSVANWRGFNAEARPITTYYSKLIASILSAFEGNEIVEAISSSGALRDVPWFI